MQHVLEQERIHILHHAGWAMDDGKVVAEEFLGPAI
jgi:hypothetical protein